MAAATAGRGGKRLGSYRELGGSNSKANWLESWKEEGILICWLHREPPWTRILHNFRRLEVEETRDGVARKIAWLPWVCWEEEGYYKARRFEKEKAPGAEFCPACRLIEHLESRDDLADDAVIFEFKASARDKREILKVDLIGKGAAKNSYQDDLTGKTEFVIPVIPALAPEKGVCLTNERWSLGQALSDRIVKDIKLYGDEEGDPQRTPTCYTFEFDSKQKKYGVGRYEKGKLTDEIRKLWEGPSPDAAPFVRYGNPKVLFEAMKGALVVDLDLEAIFAPSIADWEKGKPEDIDFDPAKLEAENSAVQRAAASRSSKAEKPAPEKEKPAPEKEKPAPEKEKPAPEKEKPAPEKESKVPPPSGPSGAPPPRPTRPTAPPEKKVIVYACEACGADWPEDKPKCPSCGLSAADEPADPPQGKAKF